MSYMKRYLEDVSVEIGYGGEINWKVLAVAQQRLAEKQKEDEEQEEDEVEEQDEDEEED